MSLDGHHGALTSAGLDVHELEMDIGDDIFACSRADFFQEEFLDAMSLDTLSFCEYGPFSPPSSPRVALHKKDASFTHSDDVFKTTTLPPKYFKSVDSSPQKRRMISRTLGQIKSFSFEKSPVVGKSPPHQQPVKVEPMEEECKPSCLSTPKRRVLLPNASCAPSPPLVTPVFMKREMVNEALSPSKKVVKKLLTTNWTANASPIGTLPPRYYRGPDTSPEKKRAHSTTFGRVSSFTFDKMPKIEKENNIIKRANSMQ